MIALGLACGPLVGSAWARVEGETSELPRHVLERRALVEPELVLAELPAAEAAARARGDHHELALLALARANACRVVANWVCQRQAGEAAVRAGHEAGEPILLIRGLIAEARAHMALQDFSRGERLLGRAELELETSAHPELSADVMLAYSSLSFSLGKYALSGEYAERGLAVLGPEVALPLQVRLLRNLARAYAHTQRAEEARATLDRAIELAERFVDPKLSAELSLEIARLARRTGDIEAQRRHGELVMGLGATLANSQLAGLGHEVLGLAAKDAGALDEASLQLGQAQLAFAGLGLGRDELRVLREVLAVRLDLLANEAEIAPLVRRLLALDREVFESERAQAADAFEARLEYARQQLELLRLEGEAALAAERDQHFAQRIRLNRIVGGLLVLIVIVLGRSFVVQRRSNRRLRKALTALQQSEARAGDLLRLSTGYLLLHDLEGQVLMVNPAAAVALGRKPDDLPGHSLLELAAPGHEESWSNYLERVRSTDHDEGTLWIRRPDGEPRAWRYTSRTSPPEVEQRYVIGQAVDVTDEVERTEALRQASLFDALTQVYNRRYLHEFEHDHLGDHSWGVVYFDLDGFKRINDTQGHERGDQILIELARFLQQRVRASDAVVRIGGDEFVILLAHADEAAVHAQVERLRRDAATAPTAFSMGHAIRSGQETLSETLARADVAMYHSRGREVGSSWDHPDLDN